MEKIYKLGLDIGTNSVGWALLDQNNNLVKKNGFTFWGVRMFDESKDAKKRRGYRSNRRRINRRKERIALLRDIFSTEIGLIDETFFQRLDDSFFKQEDKKNENFYNLFTSGYTDKDFFEQYPTIFHLRKDLVKTDKKFDLRMVYLAIHHIIKYRGNFLIQGDEFKKSDTTMIENHFQKFNDIVKELSVVFAESDENYDSDYYALIDTNKENFYSDLEKVLKHKNQKELQKLFGVKNKTLVYEYFVKILSGKECKFNELSNVKGYKYEEVKLGVSTDNLEGKIEEEKNKIPELSILFDFLKNIKEIVDYYYLLNILENKDLISDAMVDLYKNHKNDLAILKDFVKKYKPEKYSECFRNLEENLNNYASYIGMTDVSSKRIRTGHCSQDDFYY